MPRHPLWQAVDKMGAICRTCIRAIIALEILLVSGFASQGVKAQSRVEEAVRLSQLTISAFECSVLAVDQKEGKRLWDIGFAAGHKFLDELGSLTDEEDKKVSQNIAMLWNFISGPSHDFVLGRLYDDRITNVLKTVVGDDKKITAMRQEQAFQQKNCALIR